MHYLIRVRKKASEKPEYDKDAPPTQYAKLAYFRGVEDLRSPDIEKSRRRDVLESAIKGKGVEMHPKWPLSRVETGHVIPFVQVEPKRRQMGKAVYKGELSIPDDVVRKHNKRHRRYDGGVTDGY